MAASPGGQPGGLPAGLSSGFPSPTFPSFVAPGPSGGYAPAALAFLPLPSFVAAPPFPQQQQQQQQQQWSPFGFSAAALPVTPPLGRRRGSGAVGGISLLDSPEGKQSLESSSFSSPSPFLLAQPLPFSAGFTPPPGSQSASQWMMGVAPPSARRTRRRRRSLGLGSAFGEAEEGGEAAAAAAAAEAGLEEKVPELRLSPARSLARRRRESLSAAVVPQSQRRLTAADLHSIASESIVWLETTGRILYLDLDLFELDFQTNQQLISHLVTWKRTREPEESKAEGANELSPARRGSTSAMAISEPSTPPRSSSSSSSAAFASAFAAASTSPIASRIPSRIPFVPSLQEWEWDITQQGGPYISEPNKTFLEVMKRLDALRVHPLIQLTISFSKRASSATIVTSVLSETPLDSYKYANILTAETLVQWYTEGAVTRPRDPGVVRSWMASIRALRDVVPLLDALIGILQTDFDIWPKPFPEYYIQQCRHGLLEEPVLGPSAAELKADQQQQLAARNAALVASRGYGLTAEEGIRLQQQFAEMEPAEEYTAARLPLMSDPKTNECWAVSDLLESWNNGLNRWPMLAPIWPTTRQPFGTWELLTLLWLAVEHRLPLHPLVRHLLLNGVEDAWHLRQLVEADPEVRTREIANDEDFLFVLTQPSTAEAIGQWLPGETQIVPEVKEALETGLLEPMNYGAYTHWIPSAVPALVPEAQWEAWTQEQKNLHTEQEEAAYASVREAPWFRDLTAAKPLTNRERVHARARIQKEVINIMDSYLVMLQPRRQWPPAATSDSLIETLSFLLRDLNTSLRQYDGEPLASYVPDLELRQRLIELGISEQ